MTTAMIREKLHGLIDTADDPWVDEAFVKEMDQRVTDFETGKDKGVSWEEVKLKARLRRQPK